VQSSIQFKHYYLSYKAITYKSAKSKADTLSGSYIKGFLSASSGIYFIKSYIFVTTSCHAYGVKTFFPSEPVDTLIDD
jgi:hypothetical protein